jgi:rubrerythrin
MSESDAFWREREIRARLLFPNCTHPIRVECPEAGKSDLAGKYVCGVCGLLLKDLRKPTEEQQLQQLQEEVEIEKRRRWQADANIRKQIVDPTARLKQNMGFMRDIIETETRKLAGAQQRIAEVQGLTCRQCHKAIPYSKGHRSTLCVRCRRKRDVQRARAWQKRKRD